LFAGQGLGTPDKAFVGNAGVTLHLEHAVADQPDRRVESVSADA
jgi:hypothetical protein